MSASFSGPGKLTTITSPSPTPFTDVAVNNGVDTDVITVSVSVGGATISYDGGAPVTSITLTLAQYDAANNVDGLVFTPAASGGSTLNFSLASAGGSILATKLESVTCFVAGTMIACPDGERAVETLVAGDLVLTANGEAKPVRFLGVRRVDLAATPEYSPICIPADALADGVPSRDLRVSPEHAIMAQGVLVPAISLIGGAIVQETLDEVSYYHIQLDEHDVVIANGAPCETLLDTDDHSSFDNAEEGFVSIAYLTPCLPRVTQGPVVDSIRAAIDARLAVTA